VAAKLNIPYYVIHLGAHTGAGEGAGIENVDEAGFHQFVNHDTFREKPMVLKTPENEKRYAWNIEKVTELRTDN